MIIHWPKKMPENMGYVMFGRPERLEDLYVTGEMNINDIRCNQDCLEENKRLSRVFEDSQKAEIEKLRCRFHPRSELLQRLRVQRAQIGGTLQPRAPHSFHQQICKYKVHNGKVKRMPKNR